MLSLSAFNSSHQTTLAGTVTCSGVGLHSGKNVTLTLYPNEADTGIQFVRLDVEDAKSVVAASYLNVSHTTLGTTITNAHGTSVSTIEHLMAAFWGMGIDNALVTLDGPEVPILDGSSEPFVFMIECAGVKTLSTPRTMIEVLKTVSVKEGESSLTIRPYDGFMLDITIEYPGTVVTRSRALYDFSPERFKHTLSRARTFGFASDVEKLQANGLARGGSLDNAIVIGDDEILNPEGLRYNDEFVRHKALDCVGDFFLTGLRLRGAVSATRPGHGINNKLLRALLADTSAWRLASKAPMPEQAAPAKRQPAKRPSIFA